MKIGPSFSIVINTDGRRSALDKTIKSMSYIDYKNYEVIIVCGPTLDGTIELVESYRGAVKIGLCPERNLSMSRNIGIAMAAGDIVAFIDDDAFPEAEWLSDLAAAYDDPTVGGSGGRVYDQTGTRFQYGYAMADRLGNAWGDLDAPAEQYNFRLSDKFPYIQGTNASYRRAALLEVGGFDEEFSYYLDETDVCCRMVDMGYRIKQLRNAYVHHQFLPSHIRNVHRVVKDKFEILKNKIYFSLVNNHGHHAFHDVMKDNCKFVSDHSRELEMHASAGRASWDDVARFWADVDRAWKIGLARGLSKERRLLHSSRAAACYAGWLPFPSIIPEKGRKVYCFISGEYPPGRVGGIGTYTEAAARGLAGLGHHVHVLTSNQHGDNTVNFEDGIWVHRTAVRAIRHCPEFGYSIPTHIWNFSATMRDELFRIQHRRNISLVEAPIWDVEGIAVLAEGVFPIVTSLHTTLKIWLETHIDRALDIDFMETFGYPELALEEYMLRNSDGIHANSESILNVISEYSGFKPEGSNTKVIQHGVRDPGYETPKRDRARPSRSRINLLFVGRLEMRKGVDILFEAMDLLRSEPLQIICDVVGDEKVPWENEVPFIDQYGDRMAPHIAAERMRIRGQVPAERLNELYRSADILVVPSRYESFGLTVVEGFAYGKVVVGANTGGIAEIIDDGRTGILFEPEDYVGLARIIARLANDPAERDRLSGAARAEFISRFSSKRMASDMAAFFERFERKFIPLGEVRFSETIRAGMSLRENEIGYLLGAGSNLEFSCDGGSFFFHFWCHPWSGMVRVWCADVIIEEWDLYSETPIFKTFAAFDLGCGTIKVEPLGRRNDQSQGFEVIFYAVSAASNTALDVERGLYSRHALTSGGRNNSNRELLIRISDMQFSSPNTKTLLLWDKEMGVLTESGHWIEFAVLTATIELQFWRHKWSGIVALSLDGLLVAKWDLFSESASILSVSCNLRRPGRVRLEAIGEKSENSHGTEVILYRATSTLSQSTGNRNIIGRYPKKHDEHIVLGPATVQSQMGHITIEVLS